jgi:divinyl chlorophyllide a 8-vinyl-reductase
LPAEAAPYGSHSRASCSPRLASQWAADTFKSEKFEDAAEFGRIGRYYAIEDMLTTDPSEKYGQTTLRQHYERIAVEGQEYDPYTSVFGKASGK